MALKGDIVPNEYGRTNVLQRYLNSEFTLTLPNGKQVDQIKWFAVYDLGLGLNATHFGLGLRVQGYHGIATFEFAFGRGSFAPICRYSMRTRRPGVWV